MIKVAAVGEGKTSQLAQLAVDAIGEPDSELESAVEENLPSAPEETEEPVEDNAPLGSLTDMVDMIDDLSRSLEIQRQLFNAREQLQKVCFAVGIGKGDQEWLDSKFRGQHYPKKDIEEIIKNEEQMNRVFFERADGSVIKLKTPEGYTQKAAKAEMVEYLYEFYDMENSIKKDLDDMTEETKRLKREDVASASMTIANNMKANIDERWKRMEEKDDADPEKKKEERLLIALRSSYTFEEALATIEKHPSIVNSTMGDMENPNRVKEVGQRYGAKLKQGNNVSKLHGILSDDPEQSIERQFLHEDDYIAGKENLFGFFLIRYFSMKTWTDDSEHARESHNATCIVLNNLVAGKLDSEFRDEVVENIKKVWAKFKETA